MSCWWLDTIFSSSVLLVLDGTFVYLFNVVLVARHDVFHLQSCWCSTGLLLISFCLFYEGASTRSRSREKKEICGAILSIGRCWRWRKLHLLYASHLGPAPPSIIEKKRLVSSAVYCKSSPFHWRMPSVLWAGEPAGSDWRAFTACASTPGCCSPPPLARWMHVARRRIGLCGCIPLTIARRRLLPVQVATVKGRDYKFTIPDAPRCPTEGRLHLWIGGRKSEPAAAGAGQGLPPRKTQDSQDVQRPCTTHLRRYWGVRRREQRLLRGIHRARSILGAPPWLRVEIPPNSPLGGMWLQEKDVKCM